MSQAISEMGECVWTEDGIESGLWDTGCGNSNRMDAGSPTANGYQFCQFCGRVLVEQANEEGGE